MTTYREALKARIAAATPGRWSSPGGHTVHTLALQDTGPVCVTYDGEYIENPNHEADANFIAAARTDVELLLAQLERAEAALAFYAEKSNWVTRSGRIGTSPIDLQDRNTEHLADFPYAGGERSREALASLRAVLDAEEK